MSVQDISDVIVAGEHVFEYATQEFVDAVRTALSVKIERVNDKSYWSDNQLIDYANS